MAIQRDKVIASAEKLVAKGKIEAAIKEYERLLDDNPSDVNTLNRIGDLWVRINRNDEAVKVFTTIADHYSRDGFFLKAIAIYKKINKLDPSKLDIYAKLADLYAKQGLAMEAKSQYQVLADYYMKHGDPANALAIYRKISELDPNSINIHVKLADLYSANNQTAEALKEYDRVGRMLLKRGMLDEAVQVFRKALKIDARNVELVDSLVTALLEARNHDNAAQIVNAALETNPGSARLLALLGRVHLSKGDAGAARMALERGLAADPDEASIRETLADLHLKQGHADPALELLYPLVEKAAARGERAAAVDMLHRVLRVNSGHTPTLERLVGLYMRLNEETNILASMNTLAEAHIAQTRYDEAVKVLERLIQREPQNAQHRTKLNFVRSQMGGVDTLPNKPKAPEAIPSMEIDEPPPSFEVDSDAAPTFDIGLDSSPALELDMPEEAPVAPPVAAMPRLVPAVEQAAQQAQTEEEDDLDFITEHLTEAEVFAKYGLAEKAAEHLRAVIERVPKNLAAHDRLFRILLDEGDTEAATATAMRYVALLRESGDDAAIDTVRYEFSSRGQSLPIDEEPAAAPSKERWAEPEEAPAAIEEPEIALDDVTEEDEISFDLDEPAEEPAAAAAAEPEFSFGGEPEITFGEEPAPSAAAELTFGEEEPAPAGTGELSFEQEPTFDLSTEEAPLAGAAFDSAAAETSAPLSFDSVQEIDEEVEEFAPEPEPEPEFDLTSTADETVAFGDETVAFGDETVAFGNDAAETAASTPAAEEAPNFGQSLAAEIEAEALAFEAEEPAAVESEEPFFGVEGLEGELLGGSPSIEEIGEVDFYIDQELFREAREKVDSLLAQYPEDAQLLARRNRVDTALAEKAAPPPHVPSAPILSRDEIESELLSAIPDDDFESIPAPPPSAMPAEIAAPPAASLHEANLFADEDDFFDLAAELESELNEEEEPISLSEEEQSLEEIFKEFKKGVEQQLDSEDYDTHYNLGIAYKEMGLIDEAIGEFQLASKDPKRAVECASMLGLCFLEKGMPQLAIKWYRKGLEIPEITEEEHVGLLYDLGSAFMEVGDAQNAQKAFMEVYAMNTNYRDVVSRIKQLEGAL